MSLSKKEIDIRSAGAGDAVLLSVLASTTFYEAYFEQDDPHDLANYIVDSFSPSVVSEQLIDPDSTFFIISSDGHAAGFAKLHRGPIDASIETANTIELKRIYIVERYWGRGLGEMLLRHCGEFARQQGYESIWLGVWQQNERGQSFYAKHGFEKRGVLTFPYGESVGINDVMEKRL